MADILYSTFYDAICLKKGSVLWLVLSIFPEVPTENKPELVQVITWTNADLGHRRIYASRGENELTHCNTFGVI